MLESKQYLTNEEGKRIGVVLDVKEYQKLSNAQPSDPKCLRGLSEAELKALANSKLAPTEQGELNELLQKNSEAELSNEEETLLDELLEQSDQLTILKARALYTLKQLF